MHYIKFIFLFPIGTQRVGREEPNAVSLMCDDASGAEQMIATYDTIPCPMPEDDDSVQPMHDYDSEPIVVTFPPEDEDSSDGTGGAGAGLGVAGNPSWDPNLANTFTDVFTRQLVTDTENVYHQCADIVMRNNRNHTSKRRRKKRVVIFFGVTLFIGIIAVAIGK